MALEVERKFLDVDLTGLRIRLAAQGAHCLGAHFESNTVFETPDAALFSSGRLLRLRSQEWPGKMRHVLTLKLPAQVSAGTEQCKVREEHEVEVADVSAMRHILEGLGYSPAARYEKVREPWRLNGVEVELDILPFMRGVELEGPVEAIDAVQSCLALDNMAISTKNYHQLHQEWQQRNNLPLQRSFVFDETQRRTWRCQLGLAEDGGSTLPEQR
ncbi:MAG: class IV adenylate cyclase [Desulfovibrio sp.]|nr:class IV adenylate cyclase [Desulfovibrio sp.]